MSMMGELKFFLGFQIKQLKEGTFLSQTMYIQDILKKFGMEMPSQSRCLWRQMGISISTKKVKVSTKSFIVLRLVVCFTFVHLCMILCLACACVQGFKTLPKSAIQWPLIESCGIWFTHLTFSCGIPRAPLSIYLAIPIRIMLVPK